MTLEKKISPNYKEFPMEVLKKHFKECIRENYLEENLKEILCKIVSGATVEDVCVSYNKTPDEIEKMFKPLFREYGINGLDLTKNIVSLISKII
ncbi:MAG: hypothetical protein ACP5OG_02150 [Candidatus Nanoarchaeia archaeon]